MKLNESFVFVNFEAKNSSEVIQTLADRLHQNDMVDENYGSATIEREASHATGLPTKPFPIAIPHAEGEGVFESALAVASLKSPVGFKNMADPDEILPVEIVIMIANNSPEGQIKTLRSLAELFGEANKLLELKCKNDPVEIVNWLKEELVFDH